MKKSILYFICYIFLLTDINSQSVYFSQTNNNSVNFDFYLPQYSVRDTTLPAGYGISNTFSYIQMNDEDFGVIDSIGLPLLPQLTIDVHMPIGATNFSISLSSCQYSYFNVTNPILPALKDINPDTMNYIFNMDSVHYASNYPFMLIGATIMDEYVVFGEKGLSVSINPFEYTPTNGQIKVLTQGTISISYTMNTSLNMINPHRSTIAVERYLSALFSNYSPQNVREINKENYLIITAPIFENAISAFADYKRNVGYNVKVVNTNVTGTSFSNIKNYIQNQYNNISTRPEYVLLVGGSSFIPASAGTIGDNYDPITDLFYSTLEGNDYKADVFLGRFPVSTINELSAIVNKTLYMEMNLSGMTKKATFIAGAEYNNSWMERQFEKGHDYVVDKTFSPDGFTCDKLYQPSDIQVSQNLSNNPLFFIYSGHGNTTEWAGISFYLTNNLLVNANNTCYPFAFAFACLTGNYVNTGSICNSWINETNKGAVTYFGSSVTTLCHSDLVIEKKIFDSYFSTDVSISSIINHGMNKFRTHFWGLFNRDRVKRYLKSYNLLGDPSLIMSGVDCFYNYIFTQNVNVTSGNILNKQAEHLIRNDNTFFVNNGASVYLQAGDEILLTDGFYAAEGSDFEAVIAPCSGRAEQQSQVLDNTPPLYEYNRMPQQDSSGTSISELNSLHGLKIHPNPVSGILNIELMDTESSVAQITVFDLLGRIMLKKENLSQPELDVSALSRGMYILQVCTSDGKSLTSKFVKE